MKKKWLFIFLIAYVSNVVLQTARTDFDKNLQEKIIQKTFTLGFDSANEKSYREACWAISQFLISSKESEKGLKILISNYSLLRVELKRALLEAIYGVFPIQFNNAIQQIMSHEKIPKLFAMEALYLFRIKPSIQTNKFIDKIMRQQFLIPENDPLLIELKNYLQNHSKFKKSNVPDILALFLHQKALKQKVIYSFQRWNRNYPGLAILQLEDGSFYKNNLGQLIVFEQLARSAANLPFFITNGNTPQGLFRITGIEISNNSFIGPTPNLQLVMPNENDGQFWQGINLSTDDPLENYLQLFPQEWHNYAPITESFFASKLGRTEIIAHGTTINPEYFKQFPFYPLTPTLGCLCAKELWNTHTGKFIESDQYKITSSFLSTPGDTGYLMVINLDNQLKKVSYPEIKKLVLNFEKLLEKNK